jgi:predicted lipid-binding transport protein (Tim44 family)
VSLVLEALRLIGLDVPAGVRNAKATARLEIARARDEIRRAAWRATVLAVLSALAAAASICLVTVALIALYLWVSELYGMFAGLGADAVVLLVVIGACVWSARASLAPPDRAANVPPHRVTSEPRVEATGVDAPPRRPTAAASPGAAASAMPAAIAALIVDGRASSAASPLVTEALRRLQDLAEDPDADPLDAAASVVRSGDRKAMLGVLAGAALIGWMMGRSARDPR